MTSKELEFMKSIEKQIEDFESENNLRIATLHWGINVDCDGKITACGNDDAYRFVSMSWKEN